MFSSNIHHLPSCADYETAHALFTKTPQPGKPGSAMRATWRDPCERPLEAPRKHHYRLVASSESPEPAYYDVVLYETEMARYFRPHADGTRRVMYVADDRQASKQFMHSVLHNAARMQFRAADGENINELVWCPIASANGFSTDLWFTKEKRLLTRLSSHAPIYKFVTSNEMREWRAQFRATLKPVIIPLMEMRMGTTETLQAAQCAAFVRMKAAQKTQWRVGRGPFGSNHEAANALRLIGARNDPTEPWTSEEIEHLRDAYDATLTYLIDRRFYDLYAPTTRYSWKQRAPKEHPPLTPALITRSVMTQLLAACAPKSWALDATTKIPLPLPQFPTELPTTFSY